MSTDQTVDTAVDLGLEGAIEGSAPTARGAARPPVAVDHAPRARAHADAHRARDRGPHGRRSRSSAGSSRRTRRPSSSPRRTPARRANALFGADALGRDVFSRWLYGGLTVLWLSAAATVLGIVVGTAVGLVAAYSRNWLDDVLMRGNDVLLSFPAIIFVLLAVSAIGPKLWLIVLTVGLTHAPRVARVMRGAGQEVVERDFIKSAEVVGEKRWRIVFGELLPNVTSPLLVEIGPAHDVLDRRSWPR